MKKIKWDKIGWTLACIFLIITFNTSGIIWLATTWMSNPVEIDGNFYEQVLPIFQSWYSKPLIITFAILGIFISFGFIKILFLKNLDKKARDKQTKDLAEIFGSKEQKKDPLDKYKGNM